MMKWIHLCAAVVLLGVCSAGCATRFDPAMIRGEIARQRGVDPLAAFELNLGRFTTALLKSALTAEDGQTPFAGLSQIQLSVYETPENDGPVIDVTRIPVRGWEPVVRTLDGSRSMMVLVRSGRRLTGSDDGGAIADLVMVGAGRRKVVYGRLRGSLRPELPATLGDLFRAGGPDEVQRLLTELGDGE